MRRLLTAVLLVLCLALPAAAQEQATLISDSIEITGDTRLIADGNVEVFFQGRRLRAARIVFDQATNRLDITGPIILTEESGNIIVLASQADIAADLSEGILTSARLVLDRQLQLAANRMTRIAGRTNTLETVTASSCKVCEGNPTPLWEIRATRVVHDEVERQIYFDNAQFRLAGVPVLYLPRLRMPDPSLDRATGFLMPSVRTTSELGTGIRLPYFIVLGTSADLTLIPYVTARDSLTLGVRYRQAFATGRLQVAGSVTRDDLVAGTRGYLFVDGNFTLPMNFGLSIKGQTVSDPAYLLDYGIANLDRLDSRIEASRTRRNEHISARIISFQTLRATEDNTAIPSLIADLTFHRRFSLGALGGEGGLRLQTHNHYRSSTRPVDGPDSDSIPDGRDMGRVSARIDWRRSFILPGGIEGTVLGEAAADAYTVAQDTVFQGRTTRTHGSAGVELRWPWVKTGRNGASQVIEPVAQLIWSSSDAESLPNEDSALVEFDEAGLFSLDRFPGSDAVERGPRANLGISWTRHDPAGWSVGVTLGRVIREADLGQFGPGSGLDGRTSDWLAAVNFDLANGIALTARAVMDDNMDLTKGEARLVVNGDKTAFASSLIWAVADPLENRPDATQEVTFDARRRLGTNWTGKLSGRYDFVADEGTVAALGLEFLNECLRLDVSLSRRFTSSTIVTPTTDFSLSLGLVGFGSGVTGGPARTCRQ